MAEDDELHEFYLSCKELEIISMALDLFSSNIARMPMPISARVEVMERTCELIDEVNDVLGTLDADEQEENTVMSTHQVIQ